MNTDPRCLNEVIAGFGTSGLVVLATDSPLGYVFACELGLDFADHLCRGVLVFSMDKGRSDTGSAPTLAGALPDRHAVGFGGFTHILHEIRARTRQLRTQKKPPHLHVVDGLEPLWDKGERDPDEANRIIEGLRELAAECDLTVLVVIPLSARATRRGAMGPSAAAMLALEKADVALTLRGEDVYDWHATGRRMAELTILKPSVGSASICKLAVTENLRFCQLPVAS